MQASSVLAWEGLACMRAQPSSRVFGCNMLVRQLAHLRRSEHEGRKTPAVGSCLFITNNIVNVSSLAAHSVALVARERGFYLIDPGNDFERTQKVLGRLFARCFLLLCCKKGRT